MKSKLIFTFSVFLMCSCGQKDKILSTYEEQGNKVTVVNLNESSDTIRIKLSELAKDMQIVKLETSDSCLVGRSEYEIGDKYIVIFNFDDILLFDRNGKFIRRLAVKGRGYGEFTSITSHQFNKQENKLYASEYGREIIHCWSLPDGHYEYIRMARTGTTHNMRLLNEDTLVLTNYRIKTTPYELYAQDLQGHFLCGIPNRSAQDNNRMSVYDNLHYNGKELYYHPHFSDSVYLWQKDTLLLKYVFSSTPKQICKIHHISDRRLFYKVFYIKEEKTYESDLPGGDHIVSVSFDGYNIFYIINPENQHARCFRTLVDDYLGYKNLSERIKFSENGICSASFSPSVLLSHIQDQLKDRKLDQTIRSRLKELQNTINEEDNLILLVGKTDIKI